MLRRRGLLNAQRLLDIAHRSFAVAQSIENPQPSRMRENAEELRLKITHHISGYYNI